MISLTIMSLVTSVKDYVEITHKALQFEPLENYAELGALFSYLIISIGNVVKDFFSFSFLKNIWSIPLIIPDIASAMISEISVLDGYFHNSFTFLETSLNSPESIASNTAMLIMLKFLIGLINSLFLFLPTSTSHLITVRRFVMQGLEAGYIAGLGTLAGNFLWLSSIILGWRFFVIPWLSFDIFRYILGFILIVKYIWDSSKERRMALEDISKSKIFLLNFLLALTEQTCIYPFISNLSFGPEASVLEGFAADNYGQFLAVHGAYLFGIAIGSFSLLQFTCWFWENPAFSIYIWITTKSSNKISTSSYYKILNFTFLYCTMLCAIASIPYYGLDYTITNPIGLVPQDRILDQKKSQADNDKLITETAFLGVNPTDKNTRIRDGVHARRERWKQRLIKYQAYDASVYDQGVYDFLTIEDLNYGFDRFWLRRKMRNHQIRFRLFPGPWMRSLKKQLNKPANLSSKDENSMRTDNSQSTKSATGPRVDFFRILFEQFYHPIFHDRIPAAKLNGIQTPYGALRANNFCWRKSNFLPSAKLTAPPQVGQKQSALLASPFVPSLQGKARERELKPGLIYESSALRKFVRNFNKRTKTVLSIRKDANPLRGTSSTQPPRMGQTTVYSKRWKSLFSKIQPYGKTSNYNSYLTFRNVSKQILMPQTPYGALRDEKSFKLLNINQKMSQEDAKILTANPLRGTSSTFKASNLIPTPYGALRDGVTQPLARERQLMLVRPLSFYLQKEQAFKRKLRYYGATTMRKLTVGNQAPYFKTLMKRGFYYYKPSLRYKKTLYVASMRRGFRKKSRKQKTLIYNSALSDGQAQKSATPRDLGAIADLSFTRPEAGAPNIGGNNVGSDLRDEKQIPNRSSFSVLNKRASRYRHQIYKDVLQHWYYTPFNRLALKFDIDAFINRQPKSYYLTKNEERLLHVKRFLLSEHYDTLRWYASMQHYNAMKTNIGGTKSFASRIYNQQFQGTFKKIRHLFAITPTQENFSILKFDQPLYNNLKDKQWVYLHEELLPESTPGKSPALTRSQIELEKKPLTGQFETNQLSLVNSDNSSPAFATPTPDGALLLLGANGGVLERVNSKTSPRSAPQGESSPAEERVITSEIYNELLVKLIKECKRHIYDQTFLKNYISHRIEKRDQRNQEQINELNKRLEKLKTWLIFEKTQTPNGATRDKAINSLFTSTLSKNDDKKATNEQGNEQGVDYLTPPGRVGYSTGMEKALNDSIFTRSAPQGVSKDTNPFYPVRGNSSKNEPLAPGLATLENSRIYKSREQKLPLTLERSLAKINIINAAVAGGGYLNSRSFSLEVPRKGKETKIATIKDTINPLVSSCKKLLRTQIKLLTARTNKNLEWWRKKQRVITKRKNSRKRDRFKKQMSGVNANIEKLVLKAKQDKSNLFKTLYGNYEISDYLLDSNRLNSRNLTSLSKSAANPPVVGGTGDNPATFAWAAKAQVTTPGDLGAIASNVLRKKQDASLDLAGAQEKAKIDGSTKSGSDPNFNYWAKVTSSTSNPLQGTSRKNNNYIWEKFFVKKFRKKMSSKGRRYRSLSFGRYLTATRKPKMIGNTITDTLITAENPLSGDVFATPRDFGAIAGLSKIDGISSSTGFFLNKQEKEKRLALENSIADLKNSNLSSLDLKNGLKNVQIHKRSRHTWKKYKRHKFNTTQNKYRKRRIQSRGKLRVMSKKYKKLTATNELRQWWWNSFLPRYYNTLTFATPSLAQKPLLDAGARNNQAEQNKVKNAGGYFKPLSRTDLTNRQFLTPYGAIRDELVPQPNLIASEANSSYPTILGGGEQVLPTSLLNSDQNSSINNSTSAQYWGQKASGLTPILEVKQTLTPLDFPAPEGAESKNTALLTTVAAQIHPQANVPFYAGWDEAKRKFVVTNRLLSRRDTGLATYNATTSEKSLLSPQPPAGQGEQKQNKNSFTNAPIQGLNEGSFLYWQTDMPFNSYNIDQFIATNQSFYAPVGWRRFEFRHSLLKTWYSNYAQPLNAGATLTPLHEPQTSIILNATTMRKMINNGLSTRSSFAPKRNLGANPLQGTTRESNDGSYVTNSNQRFSAGTSSPNPFKSLYQRAIARRIKKRFKLLKQTPNQLMYTPTGPLLTEILPAHYISVFDQQYRFPRNRYLKRNLLKSAKKTTLLAMLDVSNDATKNGNSNFTGEFTLRKRIKPRRKYHKKRFIKKDGLIFPRRTKFTSIPLENAVSNAEELRWRPSSRSKQKRNVIERSKSKSNNKNIRTNPLRLRQLRRREFQQILKPSQRYQPRNGGFTWPGDYLRLEVVEMPKLKNETNQLEMNNKTLPNTGVGTSLKQKINVQPVGIMPRKYLIFKHNLVVLKKKLEKAHALHKLPQVIGEYKTLTQNKN